MSVEPFRDRFEHLNRVEGLTLCEVCTRLGWTKGNTSRLMRILGMMPEQTRHGTQIVRRRVRQDTALKLCRALHMDPVDAAF